MLVGLDQLLDTLDEDRARALGGLEKLWMVTSKKFGLGKMIIVDLEGRKRLLGPDGLEAAQPASDA